MSHALTVVLPRAHAPRHAGPRPGLEDLITDLFIFGEGGDVLFLGGSGGSENPAVQVHGGRGLNRTRSE